MTNRWGVVDFGGLLALGWLWVGCWLDVGWLWVGCWLDVGWLGGLWISRLGCV
jgi:hypothetical protein